MTQLTFWSVEHLANHFPLPDSVKDSKTQGETSPSSIAEYLTTLDPSGLYGKTSRVSSVQAVEGTLVPSLGRWLNSGMGSHIGCLTLNTSESHKDAVVCLLSDILETGDLPQRFFLSQKACAGILRRAEKRGKSLPRSLQVALEQVVSDSIAKTNGSSAQGRNNGGENVVVAPTLTASNDPSRSPQSTEVTNQIAAVHAASMVVRRLTPVECERLQGFPDNYTDIKPKGKDTPDGPRYKALGNSMAVPCMSWLGKRIQMVEDMTNG